MKLMMAPLICTIATGCLAKDPEKILGPCWNVNNLAPGRVTGQGVFITSMDGLSLQAAGCSDQDGRNSFDLKPTASNAVQEYLKDHSGDRFVRLAFHGHIDSAGGEKLLVIEQVDGLRSVQEPHWIADLERLETTSK